LVNKSHQLIFDSRPVTLKIEGSDMDAMSIQAHSNIHRLVNLWIEQQPFHHFWFSSAASFGCRVRFLRAAIISDLRRVRRLILEANMQMQPQTQATFSMPVKSHRLIASDRVERTPVRRSDGTKVGTIERLMIDKVSGKVTHAVLSFGGFMGVGIKHIPIAWDRMKYGVALDAYEINLSDEELSRTASFEADKEFDWGYRDDVIAGLNFYRVPPY
jgi:PRC-barrel domain